mgnify:CR=1 FL=1
MHQKINNLNYMNTQQISFNDMPEVLAVVLSKLEALDEKVGRLQPAPKEDDQQWFNLPDLISYLPNHPAEQTVYGWTSTRKIPFHKKGKSILFKKDEIDAWLQNGTYHKSEQDLEREASEFVSNKSKNRR